MADDIRVTVDFAGIDRLLASEPQKVETFMDWLAESVVTDAKLSMGTSPPGMSYTRGGVTHVASQPGFPPNIDTASLVNSITWEPTGQFERTVSDGVEHGIMMEDGTEDIAPRPFMAPAFGRAQERMEQDAKDQLRLEE